MSLALWYSAVDLLLLQVAFGAIFALLCATASNTDELEEALRQAIVNAMFLSRLTIKDAAIRLNRGEYSAARERQLRLALKGEKGCYLPFVEMWCRWPWRFWWRVSDQLFAILARKRMQEWFDSASEQQRGDVATVVEMVDR